MFNLIQRRMIIGAPGTIRVKNEAEAFALILQHGGGACELARIMHCFFFDQPLYEA